MQSPAHGRVARVEVLAADADEEHDDKTDDLAEDVKEHQNQPSHASRCRANMIVGSTAAVVVADVVAVVPVTVMVMVVVHEASICDDES
jgi:hypothetical protein